MIEAATTVSTVIDAPAEHVWRTVAAGGGVHEWFGAAIASCMLDGAARTCVTVDGSLLSERILSVDHATRTFRYAIDHHPLPAARMEAAIAVTDLGAASCRVK